MRHVLILCTGNSARSILGEALINHRADGRVSGHSAGSQPKAAPHPLALECLREAGIATEGLHSKSWDAFAEADAPPLDLVITVCDAAAGESCPLFPGRAARAHWGMPDPPAAGDETAQRARFAAVREALAARIDELLRWPDADWDAPDFAQRAQALHDRLAPAES
ncbi:arsenate reductase ArsC [Algiphilus aromaticivorans]|uniref:arsenate reductase ArsC n=1 Tax=Algiphilus aromaticivorans TaxID=382454 RepID=UPI000A02A72C|nr:arsenate reductase ArsC [Algiphilus aromaticivorans]